MLSAEILRSYSPPPYLNEVLRLDRVEVLPLCPPHNRCSSQGMGRLCKLFFQIRDLSR